MIRPGGQGHRRGSLSGQVITRCSPAEGGRGWWQYWETAHKGHRWDKGNIQVSPRHHDDAKAGPDGQGNRRATARLAATAGTCPKKPPASSAAPPAMTTCPATTPGPGHPRRRERENSNVTERYILLYARALDITPASFAPIRRRPGRACTPVNGELWHTRQPATTRGRRRSL